MRKINYPDQVEEIFLSYFSPDEIQEIQDKWTEIYTDNPTLSVFPDDIIKILTADFEQLLDWFFIWKELLEKNTDIENGIIDRSDGKSKLLIFNYTKYYPTIINFYYDKMTALNLYSCCYCEIPPTAKYHTKQYENRITLDLDHFFPKDQCPILALSLKNFVPACSACNSRIKNSNDFLKFYKIDNIPTEDQKEILLKISPTSSKYCFYENTQFHVLPKKGFSKKLGYLDNIDSYEIKISSDDICKHEIESFQLDERYTSEAILKEALSLLDLKRKYPPSKIQEMRNQFHGIISSEELDELIFRRKYDEKIQSNLYKLKKDLLD